MSNTVLIMGESGSGKSTSIRNLDPQETFILNVTTKPLPFRGAKKHYMRLSPDGLTGNYYTSDDYNTLRRVINIINHKRPDIKNLVLDDWQYLLANEFMRRATETGYTKYTEIARNAWQIITDLICMREDLYCFVMAHSDTDNQGKSKLKTIGKMLDEKISLEGMFTVVCHTLIIDGQYKFLTQHDGQHLARSPFEMFDRYIDNDLQLMKQKMTEYLESDL